MDDLPPAPVQGAEPDVVIEAGDVPIGPLRSLEGGLRWRMEEGTVYFSWDGAGRIAVSGGARIEVDLNANADRRAIALMLQGPGLNAIIRQRGLVMLHASGVRIAGGCVAIIGPSGAGKSTLAAALATRGFSLVADDGIVVSRGRVMPAYPSVKLWPASSAHLSLSGQSVLEGSRKIQVRLDAFASDPLPLSRIYLLADGDEMRIEPVHGSQGAIELVANASRAIALEGLNQAGHFQSCAGIAGSITIERLVRPRNLAALDRLVDLVVAREGAGNDL